MSRRKGCPKQKQSFVNKEDSSKVMSSKKPSPASEASSGSLESSNPLGYDPSTSIGPYNYSIPTPSQWSPQGYGMPYGMPGMFHTLSTGYPYTGFNITSPVYAQSIDMQSTYNFAPIS